MPEKNKWISVKNRDNFPDIDYPVLWLYESGGIIHEMIDKDWDYDFMERFLAGYEHTGPITHWMDIDLPEENK